MAQLAHVRSLNVSLNNRSEELVADRERIQARLISLQMAHYSRVDQLLAEIKAAESKSQPPLRTPAIRQRAAQITSLEETIDLLKMTDSAMKQMVEEEVKAREEVEAKLEAILATVKHIDSPSLHNSPTLVYDELSSVQTETPDLLSTPDDFSPPFSLTVDLETPGLVIFDAEDMTACGPRAIVESGTITWLSSGPGLGLGLGIE